MRNRKHTPSGVHERSLFQSQCMLSFIRYLAEGFYSEKQRKRQRKRTFCPARARARAHYSSIPPAFSDGDSNSASAPFSPSLQSLGPPKACPLVLRAPLHPALYVAISTPSLRPRGPLVGARPLKCGCVEIGRNSTKGFAPRCRRSGHSLPHRKA